jgi:hypothetical protein
VLLWWGILGKSVLALALMLVLFSVACNAAFVEAPATIVVNEEQKDFDVEIWNEGFGEEDFSVRLFGPFETAVSPSSGSIGAESAVASTVSIMHDEALVGSTFEATLEVELDGQTTSRNVRVMFKDLEEEPASGNLSGFVSLAGFYGAATTFLSVENMVNLVLVVIAAILLIAFIARFIKRLEVRK